LKKVVWAIVAVVVGILVGVLMYCNGHQSGRNGPALVSASPLAGWVPGVPMPSLPSVSLSQPMTILFMGTDVVYEREHKREIAEPNAVNGNSDTMMLVFLNPALNQVSVLHIPRDTEALVGKYGVRKINSANVLGGPDLAKETVSGLLNVPIDHYIVLNVQGLMQFVNELGGITVEVPKRMSYMDWTAKLKIDLQPGMHTLTGNQSMGFVRFRHDALGDIGRVQRQQMFLQAVIRKMADPRAWLHVPALINIAQQNIRTDLGQMEIIEALNFVHNVPKTNFKFVMLPGQFAANGDWLATTDARDIAARMANPYADTLSSRADLSICVINASSDHLAGSKVARALRKLGYMTCIDKDQADSSTVTKIIAQQGNTADAQMLQRDLGNIGEVLNSSAGNLTTSLTLIVHDDINLDKIQLSSMDLPSLKHGVPAQPIVLQPQPVPAVDTGNTTPYPPVQVDARQTQSTQNPYSSEFASPDPSPATTDSVRSSDSYSSQDWAAPQSDSRAFQPDARQSAPQSAPTPETTGDTAQ